MEWMAWTAPTAIFFTCITLLLTAMTAWELRSPSMARRGLLPMQTTRGDRLFIGLLGAAFLHLAWLFFSDGSAFVALSLSVGWMLLVGRYG